MKHPAYEMSADYAAARGIPAVRVSLRNALLLSEAKRDFIWYLQGLSLRDGGFRRVARELLEMFPERIGTPKMIEAHVVPDKVYPGDLVSNVHFDLRTAQWRRHILSRDYVTQPAKGSELISLCRGHALTVKKRSEERQLNENSRPKLNRLPLEEFLIELCLNPRVQFDLSDTDVASSETESERVIEANPQLGKDDFMAADLVYFHDIIGALVEYRARHEQNIRDSFHLTAIGRKIWETLDYVLASKGMAVVDGLQGRGKTEAVKAWCELHPGQARFVSLKGVTNVSTAFRAIASALGVTYAYVRAGSEMQAKIEDVLKRSKIMLVIDEAHFAFNQTRQMTARPELVDWIDTALYNNGVPVALITTPQFMDCLARAKNQVGWNSDQFRRRVGGRWVKLPDQNTEADIFAVARRVFPKSVEAVIKEVVGYALLSGRDLSAIGDVAKEVRFMRGTEDLKSVSVEHVRRAIDEYLIPGDTAFQTALNAAEANLPKSRRRPALPPVMDELAAPEAPDAAQEAERPESTETILTGRMSGPAPLPASRSGSPAARRGGMGAVLTAH